MLVILSTSMLSLASVASTRFLRIMSMFSKIKNKVIDKKKRFSQSILWDWERDYFDKAGVHAWTGTVPYYITSNPFIAHTYANIVIRYIQDHVQQGHYVKGEPFYILEIGTGAGKFSFYVLQRILALQKALQLDDVSIVYLMSDFTDSNIRYWKKHPVLQPYIASKVLQFALYNIEKDESIRIVADEDKTVLIKSTENPLIVFSNYLFDSIPHDVFHIENDQLYESLTSVKTSYSNLDKNTPKDMQKVDISFEHSKIDAESYYNDPIMNKILADYQKHFVKTSVLVPIAGLEGLRRLLHISKNRMLFILSDKGYNCLEHLDHLHDPGVTFHLGACFSMMVNLDAVGRYFVEKGGKAFHQSPRIGLKTSAFMIGEHVEQLTETKLACQYFLEHFGPSDFFNFHRHIRATYKQSDYKTLLSHMQLCQWDPHIFHLLIDYINSTIQQESTLVQKAFIEGMYKVEANFYHMPNCPDTFFSIGLFFHNLQYYKKAIVYYEKSLDNFEQRYTTLYNLALCYYLIDDLKSALSLFKSAKMKLGSSDEPNKVDEWIERITKKMA